MNQRIIIILIGAVTLLSAILVNLATDAIPEAWQPHQWLAWPLAILITGVGIWLSLRHAQLETSWTQLSEDDIRNQCNHKTMRQLVRTFWIDGVLKHSLYKEVLIRLNIQERPSAVDNRPWELILQQPGQPDHTIRRIHHRSLRPNEPTAAYPGRTRQWQNHHDVGISRRPAQAF
jgi:hypothetical protein